MVTFHESNIVINTCDISEFWPESPDSYRFKAINTMLLCPLLGFIPQILCPSVCPGSFLVVFLSLSLSSKAPMLLFHRGNVLLPPDRQYRP